MTLKSDKDKVTLERIHYLEDLFAKNRDKPLMELLYDHKLTADDLLIIMSRIANICIKLEEKYKNLH